MDAYLNIIQQIQAYGDSSVSSNPRLKFVDWNRGNSSIFCRNPHSKPYTIDPGATLAIFDAVRPTTIDGTTSFNVTLSPLDPSRYRFAWVGGANPGLRTNRGLTLNGIAVTFTVAANNTVDVTVPSLAPFDFTGVVAGDVVFVPGVTTGDSANILSILNTGYWQVLAVISSKHLVLARPYGSDFTAVTETQTLAADIQLQAFSAAGVQPGDSVSVSAGFSLVTQKTFEVVAVTGTFFEVVSTTPVPSESSIEPTASGLVFYNGAKSFLYVEADQECVIRVNGDTGNFQRLSPVEAGNTERPGQYLRRGPTWSLSIVNRAAVSMNIMVIHAE